MEGTEATQPTVEAAVDMIADQIMADIGQADTPKKEPAFTLAEGSQDTVATPPVKATPEVKKERIKWQGQEVEMPLDEIKNLAQMGFDYTKKTQDLAERQARIAPYEGFVNLFQRDPILAQEVASLIQKKRQPQEPQKPTFDDPIEQLKWETRQETLKEVEEKFIKPMQQHQGQMTHQQTLNQLRTQVQADPEYPKVQQAILGYVQSLPPSVQRTTALQLDQDPQAYTEMYQVFRSRLARPKTETTQTIEPEAAKTEKAPILEAAGKANEGGEIAAKRQSIAKMKQKALASGDPDAISQWLLKSGSLDNIL